MKKQTFIDNCSIDSELVTAVIRQVGGWEDFKETAPDVANHGADSGFSGFIYYTETIKFAQENLSKILALASEMATDLGYDSSFGLIASFNCLKMKPEMIAEAIYNKRSEDREVVMNALAWFVLEEVCGFLS